MLRLDAAEAAGLVEASQPLVANRLYHRLSIACCASRNKRPNVRNQRRRAVGAPLADPELSAPVFVSASGVPTRDNRCIA
jgi:hypothetical protein